MTTDEIIDKALAEDIGDGDHTSLATIPLSAPGKARLLVKDHGIICGTALADRIFQKTDPGMKTEILIGDGTIVVPGDVAFYVYGPQAAILRAERLVLNFMQRLSGIATFTRKMVEQVSGTKTKILDTRKTTPLLRELEKYAVRTGGGFNHRMGLYDMILIKDNHVDYAGGIRNAILAAVDYLRDSGRDLKIEVEVRNFDELKEVLSCGKINRIMLDNFSPSDLKIAVEEIRGRYETEASGKITLETVREYALSGVDFISAGALTHQIKSLDLSLKAC